MKEIQIQILFQNFKILKRVQISARVGRCTRRKNKKLKKNGKNHSLSWQLINCYSCTPNMANILAAHNKRLLKFHNGKSEFKPCNCRYKPSCPLNGNCRDKAIVYQATVQTKNQSKNYIGLAKLNLKRDTTTTTIPSIQIPKEMQSNFPNSFGSAKIRV